MHLKTRIKEPQEINQNKTGLCGVVAFMYSIARNDPEAYVRYALELFEKGEASLGNFKVKATDKVACEALDLKDKFNMSLVDYVTGASLRISENKKPLQHNPANLETGFFTPLTTPTELPKWFELAGYKTKYTARKRNQSAGIYDFNAAVVHFKRGDSVCLAVGWNLHERGGGDPYNALLGWVVGPDHWVVLTDVQDNSDSTIINLYSHGKIVSITLKKRLSKADKKAQRNNNPKHVISWERFLRHYYGYVAAWKSTG
jgi:ribosomal protein L21E